MLFVLIANAVFWAWFWLYFVGHSSAATSRPMIWETSRPWATAFGRAYGDETKVFEVLKAPAIRIATLVYVPCFILTWPIARWAPSDMYIAGADAEGLRLLAVTVLSFFQWFALLRLCFAVRKVIVRH
jgi:hypothetical protein